MRPGTARKHVWLSDSATCGVCLGWPPVCHSQLLLWRGASWLARLARSVITPSRKGVVKGGGGGSPSRHAWPSLRDLTSFGVMRFLQFTVFIVHRWLSTGFIPVLMTAERTSVLTSLVFYFF